MFKNLSEKPVADVQKEQVAKWKEEDLLHKCVAAREGAPSFVFYELAHRLQTASRASTM